MKSPFQLVSIEETVSRQKHIYTKHPAYKLLGLSIFTLFRYQSHDWAQTHWQALYSLFPSGWHLTLCGPVLTGWVVYGLGCVLYLVLYWLKIPFLERFKDNRLKWPWEYEAGFKRKLAKAVAVVLFNNLVVSPLFTWRGMCRGLVKFKLEQSELPSFPIFLCHFFFMMFCEDLCFYHCHRLLHWPLLYKYIHKVHHEFYDTICISSEYAHPVEFVIGNLIPIGMGGMLLCGHAHLFTFLMFTTLRLIETTEAHGGYDFPWSMTKIFPFSVNSRYHNYHHLKNIGNYSSFFIFWDSIYGTNSHYYRDLLQSDKDFKEYVPRDIASVKTE